MVAASLASAPLQFRRTAATAEALIPTSAVVPHPESCHLFLSSAPSTAKRSRPVILAAASSGSSSAAVSPSDTSTSDEGNPQIELEFISPKPEADGSYQRQNAVAESGKKLLRDIMLDGKIELYATYGKVMNCGGGGSCGTCIVEIIDGKELLNERTATEERHLKKKPDSWRLACQSIVGNKENSGKVVVQRIPQWKK